MAALSNRAQQFVSFRNLAHHVRRRHHRLRPGHRRLSTRPSHHHSPLQSRRRSTLAWSALAGFLFRRATFLVLVYSSGQATARVPSPPCQARSALAGPPCKYQRPATSPCGQSRCSATTSLVFLMRCSGSPTGLYARERRIAATTSPCVRRTKIAHTVQAGFKEVCVATAPAA